MSIICEECGEEMNSIKDIFVCENGHTILNATITDDPGARVHTKGRKQVIYKISEDKDSNTKKRKKNKTDEEIDAEILETLKTKFKFYVICFNEFIKRKIIKEDYMFKYFTNMFIKPIKNELVDLENLKDVILDDYLFFYENPDFNEKYINGNIFVPSIENLFALLYLQRRSEGEKIGKIFLISEFFELLSERNLQNKMDEYGFQILKERFCFSHKLVFKNRTKFNYLIDTRIKLICNSFQETLTIKGILSLTAATNSLIQAKTRYLFRRQISYSFETAKLYVQKFLNIYELETVVDQENLLTYLKKLVYTREQANMFLPDTEYSVFIALYIYSFHKHLYITIKKKIEDQLLIENLNPLIEQKLIFYNNLTDPSSYLRLMNYSRSKRFFSYLFYDQEIIERYDSKRF